MSVIDDLIKFKPFELRHEDKRDLFTQGLSDLTTYHYQNCHDYKKILDQLNFDPRVKSQLEDLPFLPVRLFKNNELVSVPRDQIVKTLTSSGTSGQSVSKIFLDKETAARQTQVLARLFADVMSDKRLPMLIIDAPSVLKKRDSLTARGAGILGFSIFGRNHTYALNDDYELDWQAIQNFCDQHANEPFLIFGFTAQIWEYFYRPLAKAKEKLDLTRGILLHGGGWKRLIDQAVDNTTFKTSLKKICGLSRVHNYYGMVEQTGSIFMECEAGVFHTSIYSDVIIRRADFSVCEPGEVGLVQMLSLLPKSYPGHNLLTEDLGEIVGIDNCACGRHGKQFKIHGRAQQAEIRGCSDTFAA